MLSMFMHVVVPRRLVLVKQHSSAFSEKPSPMAVYAHCFTFVPQTGALTVNSNRSSPILGIFQLEDEYSLVLTLTDGRLGEAVVTQSLLILVEDVNDNRPVFLPHEPTVTVREDSQPRVLAVLQATDRDEGPFGQVSECL